MIDLHCHLLPGIDDGPAGVEGSIELARALSADGISVVAATPHLHEGHPRVRADELAARCAELQRHVDDAGISLRIVPGAEVELLTASELSLGVLRLASYGQLGECVLVETPYGPLPSTFEHMLFQAISRHGLRALLAHPERNPTFHEDPGRLIDLVDRGIFIQVTAPALVSSDRRSRSRRLALRLIEEGLAHVLASDSHASTGSRMPRLSLAVAAAAKVAPRRAEWMVNDAPAAILAGEPLPRPPGNSTASHGRWWRLSGRR